MAKKHQPEKPVEFPKSPEPPKVYPDDIPDLPVAPEEEPDIIPDEDPFENPPYEIPPPPGEGP